MQKQTICLNMIVKNESHIIEKTLENICNKIKISYWVISDTGSTDNTVELIKISAGPASMDKSQKLVRSAIKGIKAGLRMKNREACRFCEFKDTEYCT